MSLKGRGKFIRGRSKSESRQLSDYTLRDIEPENQPGAVGPLGMYVRLARVLPLLLVVGGGLCSPDDGPGDPNFKENDGNLESDVNPKGDYHIVEEDDVYDLNRDTFAHFTKPTTFPQSPDTGQEKR